MPHIMPRAAAATAPLLALAAFAIVAVAPAARADTSTLQVYGPGAASCATYAHDRSLRINADGWILGFWTGMNFADEKNKLVGKSTDSRGIVGAVAQFCQSNPATPLYKATQTIYKQMKDAGT